MCDSVVCDDKYNQLFSHFQSNGLLNGKLFFF